MSSTAATILAAVISATISICVAMISYVSTKSASKSAIQAKLDELRQEQITEVLHQRIERYPSLWKLCQGSIAVPDLMKICPSEGWDREFCKALEGWHAEHGVFLSEETYRGVWYLRMRARHFAANATTGEDALANLHELNIIWTRGFINSDGESFGGVSALLKNDLGSYGMAALSMNPRQVNSRTTRRTDRWSITWRHGTRRNSQ